jgi:DNA-binding NarL/FixJ family response regulator
LEIIDDGRGLTGDRASDGTGHGIAGMRERAAAARGTLEAGPQPGGGFSRVRSTAAEHRVIRVLLADDQALIRAGFHVLLESAEGIEVIGEAEDGAQAVELAHRHRPDVVLMDIRMPGVDGLEATRRIDADDSLAGVKVLILTTFESDEYVYEALQAGASGFLVKDTEPAVLLHAIRVVADGEALLSPEITRRLISDIAARRPPRLQPDPAMSELTEREREIMTLVAHGLSNADIASQLYLSPLTVKTHVSRAMLKLHARDRAQLVVIAYQSGLVNPSD